jgi:signal transduction histidine kinase
MPTGTTGPAREAFERLMARFAVGLRLGGAIAAGAGALLGLAAPASPVLTVAAVAGLLAWSAGYALVTLRRGWTWWLVAGDIVVAGGLCLGFGWLVPAGGLPGWSSWLAVVASTATILPQPSPWPLWGVAGLVVVPGAYAAGVIVAGRPEVAGLAALLVLQGTVAALFMGLLRRQARTADQAFDGYQELRREAAIREARQTEVTEHCRLLHDSVSATLTAVAGGAAEQSATLRAQAGRDLQVIERIRAPAPAESPADAAAESPADAAAESPADAAAEWPDSAAAAGSDSAAGVWPDAAAAVSPNGAAGSTGGAVPGGAAAVRPGGAEPGPVDLLGWLAPVVASQPALQVDLVLDELAVPGVVAAAFAGAVAEALRNVARHTAIGPVAVRAEHADGAVRVEVTDAGPGFDPAAVPPYRRGLRDSIVARMSMVGGAAAVSSRPGAGTRVELRWPVRPGRPGPGDRAADAEATGHGAAGDLVVGRYQRWFEYALVAVLGLRHVADALLPILAHRGAYRSLAAEVAGWLLLAGTGVAGSVRLLRHRTTAAWSWLLAVGVLAGSAVATAGVAPAQELTVAHWSLGAAGWFGVVVLLRRPIGELIALIVANAGLTLVLLLHDGLMTRLSVTRLLLVAYVFAALQIGIVMAIKALDETARRSVAAAETRTAERRRAQVAQALHQARIDRYQTVFGAVVPLLTGLATGELDPAERRIQARCGVEASRMRRLFAETDDVPDPLLHELRACADLAHSRGVQVDLYVTGWLPTLTRPERRALTEAPMRLLAGAREEARVTVSGWPDRVAISVLADARRGDPPEPSPQDLAPTVTVQETVIDVEGKYRRWIEARWQR